MRASLAEREAKHPAPVVFSVPPPPVAVVAPVTVPIPAVAFRHPCGYPDAQLSMVSPADEDGQSGMQSHIAGRTEPPPESQGPPFVVAASSVASVPAPAPAPAPAATAPPAPPPAPASAAASGPPPAAVLLPPPVPAAGHRDDHASATSEGHACPTGRRKDSTHLPLPSLSLQSRSRSRSLPRSRSPPPLSLRCSRSASRRCSSSFL